MNTISRLLSAALLLAALGLPLRARAADAKPAASGDTGETAGEGEAEQQKDKGKVPTLEDRIRPVSGSLFIRKGRSELEPMVGISVNDAFFQKYMFGLKYQYHLSDNLGIELGGAFGISMASGNVNICRPEGCGTPDKSQLKGTPGDIGMIVGLGANWSPLYGKINLMAEKVIHFDTFFMGGLDGIQYKQPVLDLTQDPASTFAFGGHIGVGQHFVFNDFSALRVELRDYVYQGQRAVNGAYQSHLENQLMLDIGVSFFFPLHPSES